MSLLRIIIEFSFVLGIMVFIHELGHFIVAKLCGVRIETFSIGFGPRLFGIVRNGTDYRISALPLGGYVKMAGEMGSGDFGAPGTYATDTPDPGEFTSKTRFQRILIALAGPFANFVLSFFLVTLTAHYHHEVDKYLNGPAVVDYVPQNTPAARDGLATGDVIVRFNGIEHPTWEQILEESALNLNATLPFTYLHLGREVSGQLPIAADSGDATPESIFSAIGFIPRMQPGPVGVKDVPANTPASRAGMAAGDEVLSVDGLVPHSVETLHAYLKDRNGAPASVTLLHNGQSVVLNITPEPVEVDAQTRLYQLGFTPRPTPVDVVQLSWSKALRESFRDNRAKSLLLVRILQGLFTRHVSVKQMSGPVGIAQQIDVAFHLGAWDVVTFTAFISINLAIFNLLPFPPMDGGMIFFLLVESVIRRDVNQQVKERVYQVAFVCIICIFVFVMFNDIARLHLGR